VNLTDQHVVVLGGTSGIGAAIADLAQQNGARVTVASRRSSPSIDLTDPEGIETFFANLGPLDHLVVTANQPVSGPLTDLTPERLATATDIKLFGALWAVRAAAPSLAPSGSITLFGGHFAQRPTAGSSLGALVNGAIESLGRALAVELAPHRVNVIAPGITDSPAWDRLGDNRPGFIAAQAERLPLKRVATPHDVAAATLALLTNPAVTATVSRVDGGALVA